MTIIDENATLNNFEAWGNGFNTKEKIIEADKNSEFEKLISARNPDGITATELNDYLSYEDEEIFEILGIPYEE